MLNDEQQNENSTITKRALINVINCFLTDFAKSESELRSYTFTLAYNNSQKHTI